VDSVDTRSLALRARDGELHGFRDLYERIAPSLYAWAKIRSKPDQGLALEPEDLLQEVWLRAYEHLGDFDATQASFRSWIFGIAKNVAYETWRRRASAPAQASPSTEAALDEWPSVSTSVRTRMVRDESVVRFMEYLDAFDPVDRMLLVHCGMEDVSSHVAATRLGMGREAVIKRWKRLRERLRGSPFLELLQS